MKNTKKLTILLTTSALITTTPAMAETLLEKVTSLLPKWFKLDSGRNDIDKDKIEKFVTPAQDLNDLLRPSANVQFNQKYRKQVGGSSVSKSKYMDSVLDQRPQSISISGGRFYENAFVVDGQTQQSRLQPNQAENGTTGGITARSLGAGTKANSSQNRWVKPFDVEKIKVYDSNVPAKYGKFVGGVVDVKLKKPSGKRGGTVYYDFSNSSMEKMIYNDDANPKKTFPMEWSQFSSGFRVNSNEYEAKGNKIAVSASGNYSKNRTPNPTPEGAEEFTKFSNIKEAKSISHNIGAKSSIKMKNGDKIDLSVGTQDYNIDSNESNTQLFIVEKQGMKGQNASLSVDKKLSDNRSLQVSITHSKSKQNRKSDGNWATYNWDDDYSTQAVRDEKCYKGITTGCVTGGFGDSDQSEGVNRLNANYSFATKFGRLSIGGDLQHADLQFNRNKDHDKYQTGYDFGTGSKSGKTVEGATDKVLDASGRFRNKDDNGNFEWRSNIDNTQYGKSGILDATTKSNKANWVYRGSNVECKTESETCKKGSYALSVRKKYSKRSVRYSGLERGAYVQLTNKIGKYDLRYGIRYDYDTLLKNNTFAPRFSASTPILIDGNKFETTFGLNRYYGNSNATYHLLGKNVGQYQEQWRKMKYHTSGAKAGKTEWLDEWFNVGSNNQGVDYSQPGLKTPYKDEISVATTTPKYAFGQFRIKAIQRYGKDEFASNGDQSKLTNDGSSQYGSLSIEYNNEWGDRWGGRNTFFANTTFSNSAITNNDLYNYSGDKHDRSVYTSVNDKVFSDAQLKQLIADGTLSLKTHNLAYYNGEIISSYDIKKKQRKFHTPSALNFGYAHQIETKYGGFTTSFTGKFVISHYKLGQKYFNDGKKADTKEATWTGKGFENDKHHSPRKEKFFKGTKVNIPVYSKIYQPAVFDLDMNVSWNVVYGGRPTGLQAYVGVVNLLNKWNKGPEDGRKRPSVVRGRLYTLGVIYKF